MDSMQTFHDIKSIIEVKEEWPWWLWAMLASCNYFVNLLGNFLIKFFKKKKTPTDLFNPKLSPYDEAMQSLNDLEKEQLLQKSEVKEYHTRLTDIFKRYLSRKTNTIKCILLLMKSDGT